ncbi:MAG: PDZ domain-containing protein, partial [Candidatus Binatia bacterium]
VTAEDDEQRQVEVDIAAMPADVIDKFAWESIGVEVAMAREMVAVRRVRPGSAAEEIGFVPGDVLAAIGGREISGVDGFRKEVGAARSSSSVLVSVVRGRRLYRVVVPLTSARRQGSREGPRR